MEFRSHWIYSQNWEESNSTQPLRTFELSQPRPRIYTQALGDNPPSQQYPPPAGRARRRRGRTGGGKQARGCAIGLTCGWIALVARTERRRWPAARQLQHDRCSSGCGETPAKLGHQARLEAHMWARKELRVTGWSRAQARRWAHQLR
jgi:hypothetical protein